MSPEAIAVIQPLHSSKYESLLATFFIIAGSQIFLTNALYCVELAVSLNRDERAWRRASSAKGTRVTWNSIRAAATNPQTVLLTLLRPPRIGFMDCRSFRSNSTEAFTMVMSLRPSSFAPPCSPPRPSTWPFYSRCWQA